MRSTDEKPTITGLKRQHAYHIPETNLHLLIEQLEKDGVTTSAGGGDDDWASWFFEWGASKASFETQTGRVYTAFVPLNSPLDKLLASYLPLKLRERD